MEKRVPIVYRDLWVCWDCALFIANGDLPDDESLAESILYGIEREAPGQWVLDSANESDPEDYSSQEFSWSDCDCCGSDLGGSCERAAIVAYGTEV